MYWRHRDEHPSCSFRERTNDWTTAYRVSDFATQRQFRATVLWNEVYREMGADYWLGVGLHSGGRITRNFIFTKAKSDFTDRDVAILDLLQPHLEHRWRRLEAAAAATGALLDVDWSEPHALVLCSRGGVVEFATAESRRLLRVHGLGDRHVADWAVQRLLRDGSVAVCRDGRRLTVRATSAGDLTVLVLSEYDTRLDRLTARQRRVLEEAARGASNEGIAERLGIAAGTVRKHLEHVYEQLAVHSRTEAAALLHAAGERHETWN